MSNKRQVDSGLILIGWLAAISLFIGGCAQPPVVSAAPPNPLNSTPDLSAYTRFELFSQASVATGQSQATGQLAYLQRSSQFDVTDEAKVAIGRLHVSQTYAGTTQTQSVNVVSLLLVEFKRLDLQ